MPTFTIDISQKALDKLQREVDRTNANNGTDLTAQDWILLHLKEVAIAQELAAAVEQLRRQQQADVDTAFDAAAKAERERLLADM